MTAVEETMRHSPIATTLLRVVAVDVELAGVHFPEGTLVFANTAAAKRDPAIYGDPDRFDITREPCDKLTGRFSPALPWSRVLARG